MQPGETMPSVRERAANTFRKTLGALALVGALAAAVPNVDPAQADQPPTVYHHHAIDTTSDYEPSGQQVVEGGIAAVVVLGLGFCVTGMMRRGRHRKDYED